MELHNSTYTKSIGLLKADIIKWRMWGHLHVGKWYGTSIQWTTIGFLHVSILMGLKPHPISLHPSFCRNNRFVFIMFNSRDNFTKVRFNFWPNLSFHHFEAYFILIFDLVASLLLFLNLFKHSFMQNLKSIASHAGPSDWKFCEVPHSPEEWWDVQRCLSFGVSHIYISHLWLAYFLFCITQKNNIIFNHLHDMFHFNWVSSFYSTLGGGGG